MKRPFTPEMDRVFLAARGQYTYTEIARQLGVSVSALKRRSAALCLKSQARRTTDMWSGMAIMLYQGRRSIVWTSSMDQALRQMFPVSSTNDIAEYLGLSPSTVSKRAKALSLTKDKNYITNLRRSLLATARRYR